MKHTFFPLFLYLMYLVDVAVFHFFASVGLRAHGFMSLFWLLWFIYALLHQRMTDQLIMAFTITIVIYLTGIHGFGETLVPLLFLIAFSWVYHLWFIINKSLEQLVFVMVCLFVYLFIRQIKMASHLYDPVTYMIENKWWVVFLFNVFLYVLIAQPLFNAVCRRRERRLRIYDG